MVDVANARHLASLLAKHLAALLTRSAKTTNNFLLTQKTLSYTDSVLF